MKLISFNSGQLQDREKLQNNTVKSAMSITFNRVIEVEKKEMDQDRIPTYSRVASTLRRWVVLLDN